MPWCEDLCLEARPHGSAQIKPTSPLSRSARRKKFCNRWAIERAKRQFVSKLSSSSSFPMFCNAAYSLTISSSSMTTILLLILILLNPIKLAPRGGVEHRHGGWDRAALPDQIGGPCSLRCAQIVVGVLGVWLLCQLLETLACKVIVRRRWPAASTPPSHSASLSSLSPWILRANRRPQQLWRRGAKNGDRPPDA